MKKGNRAHASAPAPAPVPMDPMAMMQQMQQMMQMMAQFPQMQQMMASVSPASIDPVVAAVQVVSAPPRNDLHDAVSGKRNDRQRSRNNDIGRNAARGEVRENGKGEGKVGGPNLPQSPTHQSPRTNSYVIPGNEGGRQGTKPGYQAPTRAQAVQGNRNDQARTDRLHNQSSAQSPHSQHPHSQHPHSQPPHSQPKSPTAMQPSHESHYSLQIYLDESSKSIYHLLEHCYQQPGFLRFDTITETEAKVVYETERHRDEGELGIKNAGGVLKMAIKGRDSGFDRPFPKESISGMNYFTFFNFYRTRCCKDGISSTTFHSNLDDAFAQSFLHVAHCIHPLAPQSHLVPLFNKRRRRKVHEGAGKDGI
jgi:hypothetical protein